MTAIASAGWGRRTCGQPAGDVDGSGRGQDAAAAGVLGEELVELSFEPLVEPESDLPDPELELPLSDLSDLPDSLEEESLFAATPPPPERLSVR